MIRYFALLGVGRVILWCYLIWYLVTVVYYFDPSPAVWLNSLGISLVVGVALFLSVSNSGSGKAGRWQTFRLFVMPFCVSSFSSLIKGQGYILIVPPELPVLIASVGWCAVFIAFVLGVKHINKASVASGG